MTDCAGRVEAVQAGENSYFAGPAEYDCVTVRHQLHSPKVGRRRSRSPPVGRVVVPKCNTLDGSSRGGVVDCLQILCLLGIDNDNLLL